MKLTPEEFLKEKAHWASNPREVHHFTGEFVIELLREYAKPPPSPSVGEIEDIFRLNSELNIEAKCAIMRMEGFKAALKKIN